MAIASSVHKRIYQHSQGIYIFLSFLLNHAFCINIIDKEKNFICEIFYDF